MPGQAKSVVRSNFEARAGHGHLIVTFLRLGDLLSSPSPKQRLGTFGFRSQSSQQKLEGEITRKLCCNYFRNKLTNSGFPFESVLIVIVTKESFNGWSLMTFLSASIRFKSVAE